MSDRHADMVGIARATRGDLAVEEVESEAFLIALELEGKTHKVLDLSCQQDQGLLLAWMFNRLVKYADKSHRFAARIDQGWDDDGEDFRPSLAARLAGPELDDPHVRQLAIEDREQFQSVVQESYSEAAAYAVLMTRWEWDMKALAVDLLTDTRTVRARVGRATDTFAHQTMLFDGIESIADDFEPRRSRYSRAARGWLRRWWEDLARGLNSKK